MKKCSPLGSISKDKTKKVSFCYHRNGSYSYITMFDFNDDQEVSISIDERGKGNVLHCNLSEDDIQAIILAYESLKGETK